jgi:putative membrane protein
MIERYSDHAANERTFLAWVRTGIAVVAFGFVIEKFNLFILAVAQSASVRDQSRLKALSGSIGRYEGLAFILGGIVLIALATVRFIRTSSLLDDPDAHSVRSVRVEVVLSGALMILITTYSIYLAFD